MSSDDQVFANRWLHDIQSGEAKLVPGKTVQDYINDYKLTQQDHELSVLEEAMGVAPDSLRTILAAQVNVANINEYGRFDVVLDSVDLDMAAEYFHKQTGKQVPRFKVRTAADQLLRRYVLHRELPEDLKEAAARRR